MNVARRFLIFPNQVEAVGLEQGTTLDIRLKTKDANSACDVTDSDRIKSACSSMSESSTEKEVPGDKTSSPTFVTRQLRDRVVSAEF
jgi:hypothetical protein